MTNYRYHFDRMEPRSDMIFVFGGNLAGRHGKGSALYAKQHCGAIYGVGVGLQGRSYSIPTKDHQLRILDIDNIVPHILAFKNFAFSRPDLEFFVTRIGCGLAGYQDQDIAPWFYGSPLNCVFPVGWELYLSNQRLQELWSSYYS